MSDAPPPTIVANSGEAMPSAPGGSINNKGTDPHAKLIECSFPSPAENDFTFHDSDDLTPRFGKALILNLPPDQRRGIRTTPGQPGPASSAGSPNKPGQDAVTNQLKRIFSIDNRMRLKNKGKKGDKCDARVNACRCFKGSYWSLTCRLEREGGKGDPPPAWRASKIETHSSLWAPKERHDNEHLNDLNDLCWALHSKIFSAQERGRIGLLVIAGATHTGKSQISRGLIYRFLAGQKLEEHSRRPHLVTFEDPIEVAYTEAHKRILNREVPEASDLRVLNNPTRWLDYTPRQLHWDAQDLASVLSDALRQTPTVVLVGETRNDKDWPHLIRFARSGHLIVTTTHAGSLTEAMGRIFSATRANTPQKRSQVAECLLAVVHLRAETFTYGSKERKRIQVLVPALWRKTLAGLNQLIADGLESLVPSTLRRPEPVNRAGSPVKAVVDDPDLEKGCLGRVAFIEYLVNSRRDAKDADLPGLGLAPENLEEFKAKLKTQATDWDLGGV